MPSGVSYVISNRRVMAQTLPELFVSHAGAARRRLPATGCSPRCARAAPDGRRGPDRRRADARRLQLRLLRAHPARAPDGRRAGRGPRPVLLGRPGVDAHDAPVPRASTSSTAASTTSSSTRCSSAPTRCSARPGSCSRARLGNVTIANAVGNGVADDKLRLHLRARPHPLLPRARSRSSRTSTPGGSRSPGALEEVLDRLDELVVKPVDGSGGKGLVVGPDASRSELDELRGAAARRPARLDRAAGRAALDDPDPRRGRHAPAPRRPAPVRGERRRRRVGAAGRPHPRRAARGPARRELEPGRRIEGHLGARRQPSRSLGDRAGQRGSRRRRRPGRGRSRRPRRSPRSAAPHHRRTDRASPQDRTQPVRQQQQQRQQQPAQSTPGPTARSARC